MSLILKKSSAIKNQKLFISIHPFSEFDIWNLSLSICNSKISVNYKFWKPLLIENLENRIKLNLKYKNISEFHISELNRITRNQSEFENIILILIFSRIALILKNKNRFETLNSEFIWILKKFQIKIIF